MSKDPDGGGTNADGARNEEFCSLCWRDGAFVHADFSAAQMQSFCVDELRKKGMPKFMAWLFTRGIPRLKRWRPA